MPEEKCGAGFVNSIVTSYLDACFSPTRTTRIELFVPAHDITLIDKVYFHFASAAKKRRTFPAGDSSRAKAGGVREGKTQAIVR
jgi:hypothetical protein